MLLYIAFAVIASAVMDETETRVVEKELEFYNRLVDENGLDRRAEKKKAKVEAKRALAKEEAEKEKVDLL